MDFYNLEGERSWEDEKAPFFLLKNPKDRSAVLVNKYKFYGGNQLWKSSDYLF